jgi:nucleotide-binding universal stress UspA family protein
MTKEPYIVLVGMDFSELADLALAEAFELASCRDNAEIHVVSVVSPPSPAPTIDGNFAGLGYAQANDGDPLADVAEKLRAHVQAELDALVVRAAERGGKVSGRIVSHVRMDNPGIGIAQLASDLKAKLIVLGTHGRRGLARILMGSVAETTVRYARCPVLVVPSIEQANEVKIEPPCPECLRARAAPGSKELWCAQHRERHGRRHTYHQTSLSGTETNFPLTFQ